MLELFLILLVCPIATGGVILVLARNNGASFLAAMAVSLLSAVVFTALVFWVVNECELSAYLRRELRGRLTREEWNTLHGEGLICPTSYWFQARGTRTHAFVVDGFRGAKVFIGED